MTKPHKDNFCGGAYQDWLEVKLTNKCNGRCPWCIEKNGFKPRHEAAWHEMFSAILKTGKRNVLLLGGEPTLHQHLEKLLRHLHEEGVKTHITTNGSRLTQEFVISNFKTLTGINISIHHYDLSKNEAITGIRLLNLYRSVRALHHLGIQVRLNCNLIEGKIDSKKKIENYLEFAKGLGIFDVRFAELKGPDGGFVDLNKILEGKHGLNDDPFTKGCVKTAVIEGIMVNFRQMCGIQTPHRAKPPCPEQCHKEVLYPDGKIYPGWLTQEEGDKLQTIVSSTNPVDAILSRMESGPVKSLQELSDAFVEAGGCRY